MLPRVSIERVRLAVANPIIKAEPDTYAAPIMKALAANHAVAGNVCIFLNSKTRTRRRISRRLMYATGAT